jgi:phosphoglycolate phosphatase
LQKYHHIIWDWNGTLLDDAWLCNEIMNGMLQGRDLPPLSPQRYSEIFDFPVKDYYQKAGWDFDKVPWEVLSDEFINEYNARMLECPLREDTAEVLESVAGKDISQSIISAAKQTMVEEMVKHFQITDLFTAVRGLDNHHAFGKVDIGLQWINTLDIDPGQVLMVGDTIHDHEVAQAMGVDCLLIPSGHQSRTRLEACGVAVIETLREVERFLFTNEQGA